jgi:hypothetical protein
MFRWWRHSNATRQVGWTRAYNSSMGYFDIVNDQFQLLEKDQQDCNRDETPMFLESIAGDAET